MSNNPLSKRAQKALEIIEAGGKFRHGLERNDYTGREQFHTRLLTKTGGRVRGIGFQTFCELERCLCIIKGGTSVSTYYGLPYVHNIDPPQQF